MKFSDIRRCFRAHYKINCNWRNLERYLASLDEMLGLDLSPPFQRDLVWTETQKTRYVEYRLQEGPSARELSFNCIGWDSHPKGPIQLVDGQQRLHAVRSFLRGEVKAFGLYIHEFDQDFDKYHGPDFIVHINSLSTKAEVIEWYLQINTYGTPHSEAEITKARYLLQKERVTEPK